MLVSGQLLRAALSRVERHISNYGKALCSGLVLPTIDFAHPSCLRPYRGAGKTLIQQYQRRSQGVPIRDKRGKAAGGILAVGFVEPDFIALHGNPIHGSAHVTACMESPHCAMLTARDSFAPAAGRLCSEIPGGAAQDEKAWAAADFGWHLRSPQEQPLSTPAGRTR